VTRDLAKSTLKRLRRNLEDEEARLLVVVAEYDNVFSEVNLGSTSAEHNADPNSADGGALASNGRRHLWPMCWQWKGDPADTTVGVALRDHPHRVRQQSVEVAVQPSGARA